MPEEMQGRRIPVVDPKTDPYFLLTESGDYYGPVVDSGITRVFFLLPNGRDEGTYGPGRCLHHVAAPPHVIREEPDGSLTIRESILSRDGDGKEIWHGYLTEGRWELNKSKL